MGKIVPAFAILTPQAELRRAQTEIETLTMHVKLLEKQRSIDKAILPLLCALLLREPDKMPVTISLEEVKGPFDFKYGKSADGKSLVIMARLTPPPEKPSDN